MTAVVLIRVLIPVPDLAMVVVRAGVMIAPMAVATVTPMVSVAVSVALSVAA
ncbi:hypothetical protein [Planotetraspora silvatica]|nr:hypothetical protein [Planotetraspora silvatica]